MLGSDQAELVNKYHEKISDRLTLRFLFGIDYDLSGFIEFPIKAFRKITKVMNFTGLS